MNYDLDSYYEQSLSPDKIEGFKTIVNSVVTCYEDIFGHIPTEGLTISFCDKDPECSNDKSHIYLSLNDERPINCYEIIVYQLAHEFCHFLIKDSVASNLRWFVETICQVASCYFLVKVSDKWEKFNQDSRYHGYYGKFIYCKMVNSIAPDKFTSFDLNDLHDSESTTIKRLEKDPYRRNLNTFVANNIEQFFFNDPNLWRVVPYLCKIESKLSFVDSLYRWKEIAPKSLASTIEPLITFLVSRKVLVSE